ncbi:MAG: hypothetical protein WCF17_13970 [Terracidiphilus sp.]
MRSTALHAILLLTGLIVSAGAQTPGTNGNMGQPMGPPPTVDVSGIQQQMQLKQAAGALKITYGKKHAEWTAQSLAPLPHVAISVYNEHAKANQTYSGVPLIALLTPLGVPDKPHGKDFRLYLVAEGSDGYQVVYSVAEVTPDVHDATVLVADSMDGKAIGDSGSLQLVATGEKRPARWVHSLIAIRVMTAQ